MTSPQRNPTCVRRCPFGNLMRSQSRSSLGIILVKVMITLGECKSPQGRGDSRIEPKTEHTFSKYRAGRSASEGEAKESRGETAKKGRHEEGGKHPVGAAGRPSAASEPRRRWHVGPACSLFWGLACALGGVRQHPDLYPPNASRIPPSSCDNAKCPQTLLTGPWRQRSPPVENTGLEEEGI